MATLNSKPAQQRSINPLSFVILLSAVCFFAGCANNDSLQRQTASSEEGFLDESISSFHNLSWIGAQSHPLNRALSFPDPEDQESTVSPGGLVIANVFEDSIAADAKLTKGQVIVGVGDKWLPINDDPTIDFIRLLEANVAGGQDSTLLQVYDGQSLRNVEIKNVTTSLEHGIDKSIERYQAAHLKGLQYLASQQNENGSFGSEEDFDQTMQSTCIAGLSFLSASGDQFKSNVDQCLEYVASQLDLKAETAKKSEQETDSPAPEATPSPGVVMMQMPEFELEPLTAAYIAQLFAESDIQMIDQKWMPRIMGTIGALSKTQHESGAWNAADETADDNIKPDHAWATFTTNQVLLGVGMLERKGVMGNAELIQKACKYLKEAAVARSGNGMDRRLKNSLTSGTAAALLSLNCKATDAFLKQAVEDGLSRIGECHTSPRLTLPGVLSMAILSRQTSPEAWEQFHTETKHWLSSLQLPDGSFQPTDRAGDATLQSAYYCILLSMASDTLPAMKANTKSPMAVARNSSGEEVEGSKTAAAQALPDGIPAGAQVMSFSMDDLSGEGSLEDQIKEKLKSMGIEGDIEIGSAGESRSDEDE